MSNRHSIGTNEPEGVGVLNSPKPDPTGVAPPNSVDGT